MASKSLICTHVSSILSVTPVNNIEIPTIQRDLPLPDDTHFDLNNEHASHSVYYNINEHPTLLLRVINNSYTIQLSSVSGHLAPIRFNFPSPIISIPFIIPDQYSEAHLIACTASGSVYRLKLPVPALWRGSRLPKDWCSEHVVRSVTKDQLSIFHVSDPGLVLIGLKDGTILKLAASRPSGRSSFDDWSESIMRPSTGLSAILPSFHSRTGYNDIVAFASAPSPEFTEVAFTLSRDRHLRVWKDGCIGVTQIPGVPDGSSKSIPLLPPVQKPFIRVLPPVDPDDTDNDSGRRVLVFMPTSTEAFGGFFVQYTLMGRTNNGSRHLDFMFGQKCSISSAGSEMRDFVVIDDVVWVLWDKHGETMVEYCPLDPESDENSWLQASSLPQPDYSPAYFDDLLLQDGSMTEIFMGAILRPGMFSRLTLQTALQQYCDSLLQLPNIQNSCPSLTMSYPTLSERIAAVVGCTVDLAVDPSTGEQLWDSYWSALKRDWEGFIARCKDIERNARWPLSLGRGEGGCLVVLERERLGVVATDDAPLKLYKTMNGIIPPSARKDSASIIFETAWTLFNNLTTAQKHPIEANILTFTKEKPAFSYTDVAADIARRLLLPQIPENIAHFISTRVGSFQDLGDALNDSIDAILTLTDEVKLEHVEEDDGRLLLRGGSAASDFAEKWDNSDWLKGLTAGYISASVSARYQLALILLFLLMFIADQHPDQLHTEGPIRSAVAAFHGAAMMRHITLQTAGDPGGNQLELTNEDEFLAQLQGMRMNSAGPPSTISTITYSLLHVLIERNKHVFKLAESAHDFLRLNGLLRSHTDVDHPLLAEVKLIAKVRNLGYLDFAREVAEWVPTSPGVAYALARVRLDSGRFDEAATLFQRVANSFASAGLIDNEDYDALVAALPEDFSRCTLATYYRHVANLYEELSLDTFVILFGKLSIDSAVPEEMVEDLWDKVFRCYVSLGLYEEAYMMMVSITREELRKNFIRHLVAVMCDNGEVDRLTRLNFVGFQDEVERTLAFKARNSDPLAWPDYSKVLYAWHVFRGDYRSAGGTMYLQARRLGEVQCGPGEFVDLAQAQAQCYLAAINTLSLIDPKNAWVAVRVSGGDEGSKNKARRRQLCVDIPDDKFTPEARDELEAVQLSDVRQEYMLVLSRLDLARKYPDYDVTKFAIGPADIVSRYVQDGAFDDAISAARSLQVPMNGLFENLTSRCVQLSRLSHEHADDVAPWLISDRVQSWEGTPAQRGWRYLQESLERNDTPDFVYRKVALKKMLDEDRFARLPVWLVQFFEEHQPDHLIRMCLKYDLVEDALKYSIALVKGMDVGPRRSGKTRSKGHFDQRAQSSFSRWLPVLVLDQVLSVAEADSSMTERLSLASTLRKEIDAWKAKANRAGEELLRNQDSFFLKA
ncbi:hypothetical protein FRC03_006142 [Tulasnella sp. 419]|nr:hypothetical protein FRC03_006142 [Tulasnella sp. 419]